MPPMITLEILGSPRLTDAEGRSIRSVLSQPKRLALLSYLAVTASGGYQSRDTLLALFWPESDEKRARSSLSEALSRLRRSVGSDVLLTRGSNEVGIDPGALRSDVQLFEAAVQGGDCATVADLYRGPFLEGFVLDNGPDFDQWLESTRARFARSALGLIGQHADELFAAGDPRALACAERVVQLNPLEGHAVARVMRIMAASGHRAAAIDAYSVFRDRLAEELGMEPGPEIETLASEIRNGGRAERHGKPPVLLLDGHVGAGSEERSAVQAGTSDPGEEETSRGAGRSQEGWRPPAEGTRTTARPASRRGVLLGAMAGAIAVILGASLAAWALRSSPDDEAGGVIRMRLSIPADQAMTQFGQYDISDDGSMLVYSGIAEDGRSRLWVRRFDRLEAEPVYGTEEWARFPHDPEFSPDGRWIAYWSEHCEQGDPIATDCSPPGDLLVIPVEGGDPVVLVDGPVLSMPKWSPEGDWIYFNHGERPWSVARVSASGGEAEIVHRADEEAGEDRLQHYDVLPGERIVVGVPMKDGRYLVQAVDLRSGRKRTLSTGHNPRYAAGGVFFTARRPDGTWVREGPETLFYAPIDGETLSFTEEPRVVVTGLRPPEAWLGWSNFSVSSDGTLVYSRGSIRHMTGAVDGVASEFVWVDREGVQRPALEGLTFDPGLFNLSMKLSPDGSRVASREFSGPGRVAELWVTDLRTGRRVELTESGMGASRPRWSPDGEHVTFQSARDGKSEIWRRWADGRGRPERIFSGDSDVSLLDVRGDTLLYRTAGRPTFVHTVVPDGEGPEGAIVEHPRLRLSALSPDGRWLAYMAEEGQDMQVYVVPFPEGSSGGRWQVSRGHGRAPRWARSGRELFFISSGRMMSVEVGDGDDFTFSEPRYLFDVPAGGWFGPGDESYDVAPGDSLFLMIRNAVQDSVPDAPFEVIYVSDALHDLKGGPEGH